MNLSRHWIRTAFFKRLKIERKNYKQLKKGSVFDTFSSFFKKVVLGATGLSILSAPAFGSEITAHGSHTKINKNVNGSINTFTITTDQIKGENAFNAFKKFTLTSNDIANLHLPNNTKNLLNFVYDKIDINGTVNAIKNNKYGGNLYFLSSNGLVLGKNGVINAGAFYAMTPNKAFMDKLKGTSGINTEYDLEIGWITDKKIVNRNLVNYKSGIILEPDGEIVIEGKINTLNGIGLYAGGQLKDGSNNLVGGVKIKNGASLKTLSVSDFSSVVNTSGIALPDSTEFVEKDGKIEIVSVGDNTHASNFISSYITGFADTQKLFSSESRKNADGLAEVNIEAGTNIVSRNDINIEAITTNGQLSKLYTEDRAHEYTSPSTFNNLSSKVKIGGNVTAKGNLNVKATADNNFISSSFNVLNLGMNLLGSMTPFNFSAYPVLSDIYTNIEISKGAVLQAGKNVDIKADSFSNIQAGASTSPWAIKSALHGLGTYIPSVGVVYVEAGSSAQVDVAGAVKSNSATQQDGNVTINAVSENRIAVSATASNTNTENVAIALSISKGKNTALINIKDGAAFDAKGMISIEAEALNRPNVSSTGEVGNDSYGTGALAYSDFVSSATVNINADIKPENQVGSLTIGAFNDSWENTCSAATSVGIGSTTHYINNLKTNIAASILSILPDKFALDALPANSSKNFSLGGAVAIDLGKYDSKVTFGSGKKIETNGDVNVYAETLMEDVNIKALSSGEAGTKDTEGKKSGINLGFVYSDVKHNADVVFADSEKSKRTEIKGKSIDIKSSVNIPYNRVHRMIEDVEWAITVLKARVSSEEQKALITKITDSFQKLKEDFQNLTNSEVLSTSGLSKLGSILGDLGGSIGALTSLVTGEISVVTSAVNIVTSAFEFLSPTNYVQVGSASSGSYSGGKDSESRLKNLSFSGSVDLTYFDNNSHVFLGKNTKLSSMGTASKTIDIGASNNIYLTTTAGSPNLYGISGGSATIGGSFIMQKFNSVAESVISDGTVLLAPGTSGSNGTDIAIASTNEVDSVIAAFVGSKGSSGFDGMVTYSYGDLHANTLVDSSVDVTANRFSMNAYNYDNVVNISGALMISDNSGVGAGIAISEYDKETYAKFENNDDKSNSLSKSYGIATYTASNAIATQTVNVFEGISKTSGTFNTVGVAASVAMFGDSAEQGAIGKFFSEISDFKESCVNKVCGTVGDLTKKFFDSISKLEFRDITENRQIPAQGGGSGSGQRPEFSLNLAGSSGVNIIVNKTATIFDKANIVSKGNDPKVSATAINTAHTLAFAGAAGVNICSSTKQENQNKTTVGINGAVAVNSIDNTTEAGIKNSKIKDAKNIESLAVSGGDNVTSALGLGLNFGSGSEKKTHGISANFNVNLIDETINSKLDNNTVVGNVTHTTDINNTAYNGSLNITGGVGVTAGKQKSSSAGTVNIEKITNNLTAAVIGGKYSNIKNLYNQALMAVLQINGAIAVAVAPHSGDGSYAFSAAAAYSKIDNTGNSYISGSNITADGKISVLSRDVRYSSDAAKPYHNLLDRDSSEIADLDKEGKTFYTGLDTATNTEDLSVVSKKNQGSLLVSAAATGAGGDVAVGAGIVVNKIVNNLNAKITGATLDANEVSVNSWDNSLMISVGGGIAGSADANKGAGAGSFVWSDIDNKATTQIANSSLNLNVLNANSTNSGYITSIAGQIAATSGKGAGGASIALNRITNSAESEIYGGSLKGKTNTTSKANVTAENKGTIVGVGVSIAASKEVAVDGTVVINEIENNGNARVGSTTAALTKVENINEFNIKATDTARIYSLSGAVTGSGKVAAGGAIAVNTIDGDTSAKLINSRVSASKVDIAAVGDSKIMTMAAGFGGSGNIAFNGASTVGDIFRDVTASVENTIATTTANMNMNVRAYSKGEVDAIATVVSGSGKAAIGAGVTVSRIDCDTSALAKSNDLNLKNLVLRSDSNQKINVIGVAGAGAGTAGIAGSFAYNSQNNDIISKIDGGKIIASNNIGVIAQSDDEIGNYAGVAGIGGTAGVGVSLGINYIDGTTKALVQNANVSAYGTDASSDKLTVNNKIDNNKIYNDYASLDSINLNFNLRNERQGVNKSGLVVDSSSSRTMKSFVASVGGGGTAGVNSNIAVNYIGGSTNAEVNNSVLNNSTKSGNVSVNASDYTDSSSFIGSVAIGGGAGVGASANTNKVTRDTTARVSNITTLSSAQDMEVKAVSKQGLSTLTAGIAGAGTGAVAGNIAITLLEGTTKAELTNAKLKLKSLDVNADHYARVHMLNGSAALSGVAGIGASISVSTDSDTVKATVASSAIQTPFGDGSFNVKALNDTEFESSCAGVGIGVAGAGVAGSINVNYMEQDVDAEVINSSIGSSTVRAGSLSVTAEDKSRLNSYGGSLGGGLYAGVGVAVNVNTIDSKVNSRIENSSIYTKNKVDINTKYENNGEQGIGCAGFGAGGVGINVAVFNIGSKYSETINGDKADSMIEGVGNADAVVKLDQISGNDFGYLSDDEKKNLLNKDVYLVSKESGKATNRTDIKNSVLDSSSEYINVNTNSNGDIKLYSVSVSGGVGAVTGSWGYIDNNQGSVTNIENSKLTAKNALNVQTTTGGSNYILMEQGAGGIVGVAGGFSGLSTTGMTSTKVDRSTLISNNDSIYVSSLDNTSASVEAAGVQAGAAAVGVVVSKTTNESTSQTTINSSNLKTNRNKSSSNISVNAKKDNDISSDVMGGSAGIAAIGVFYGNATDLGKTIVNITGANNLTASAIDVRAVNKQKLNASMGTGSFGGVSIGVGDINANAIGTANVNVNAGSKYNADVLAIHGQVDTDITSKSRGYNVGVVGIDVNHAEATANSTVNVNVKAGQKDFANVNTLKIDGSNNNVSDVNVDGLGAGVVSVLNNKASATADLNTYVTLTGDNKGSDFNKLSVTASSNANHKIYSNGDGGGIVSVSPYSAQSYSKMAFNSNTNVYGNLKAKDVEVYSKSSANSKTSAMATQGAAAGGCGTEAVTDVKADAINNINKNAKITADKIYLNATNEVVTGDERDGYNARGRMHGGIVGTGNESNQTVNNNTKVNVADNVELKAAKSLKIDTKTILDLKNKIYSNSAGIGTHPYGTSKSVQTLNNIVSIGSGSLLSTTGDGADISIGTYNNYKFNLYSEAEVLGSAEGSSSANTKETLNNTNQIDVKGNIKSIHDISLYTDKDANGQKSNLTADFTAEALNKAAIPVYTDADLSIELNKNNTINVFSNANLESIRHINLSATNSSEKITTYSREYNWLKGDEEKPSTTTVTSGELSNTGKNTDTIKVDGKVIAGINNKVNMQISGKVSLDQTVSGDGIVYAPTITSNKDEYKNAVSVKTVNYANKLYERYKELQKLIVEYNGTQAGLSYQAELIRVQAEMEKYGLFDTATKIPTGQLYVDAIELPDMFSSGGNVYISTATGSCVIGSGLIQAKGAPEINIKNDSTLYMIVNDLKVEDYGGEIVLNNNSLADKAQSVLKVKEAKTDASSGSKIDISENWNSVFDVVVKKDGKSYTVNNVSPLTNIEINGHVDNPLGLINIYNAKKDIVLQGKSTTDSASISGATISISTPNGSISQSYSQGITNIGYSPEYVWAKYVADQEDKISKGVSTNMVKRDSVNLSDAEIQKMVDEYKEQHPEIAGGVWIAGNNVFLNADDININGIIQSGYAKFEVNLNSSAYDSKITEIANTYKQNNSPHVTEAYLSQYCQLNKGGMVWDDSAKAYKYEVQAFYNPELDRIELEDISSNGGKIYLTGRISSTGSGKIWAADGASDITINNTTNKTLVASTLDTGDRKGFISIMDLAKTKNASGNDILATLTEMTSDETKVWYITSKGQGANPDKTSGVSTVYNPLANLTYNWSTGFNSIDEYKYQESEDFTIWGLIDYNKQCENHFWEKKNNGELNFDRVEAPKINGIHIGIENNINHSNNYNIYFNNSVNYTNGPNTNSTTKYDNWTHFSGTVYTTTTYSQGNTLVFDHSVKADYPIGIGFLHGSGDISVNTKSNLVLSGDVYSKTGNVKLTSTGGNIIQNAGKIKANNVWLTAKTGIGAGSDHIFHLMSENTGTLSAVTNSGDVNLNSTNIGGLLNSSLKLTAKTDSGNVQVIADSSLLSGGTGVDIKGSRIDLISNNGSIGTAKSALKIIAGQEATEKGNTLSASVNAKAVNDIALEQTQGDMRIGKIVSNGGDVYLTSAGGIIDALPPKAEEQRSASAEKLINSWIEAGIISVDGNDNSEERKQEALNNYENGAKTSFDRYLVLKKIFTGKDASQNQSYNDEYLRLKKLFGDYTSFDKWFTAEKANKDSEYNKLKNSTEFGWTKEELLYAVKSSIINKEGGSSRPEKTKDDANIKARNITLVAGAGIGRDEGTKVVDISDLKSEAGIEVLKEIADTEADDITWGYADGKKDANKATINKVNGICIDASGNLNATAKGNVYLEDVAGNAINVNSVNSTDGNIRVYGKNGIYNVGKFTEGASDNTVNFAGNELIIEGGVESIGSSAKPVTTNMAGHITARSDKSVNLYQIGLNPMTIAAIYSGASLNLRAVNSIFSVYNGVEADELGYINSKGDITLLSDTGDIGQANSNGLRIHQNENMLLNAEAENIYIKGVGDAALELGEINARTGTLSIDTSSSNTDVVLKRNLSAMNFELKANSVTQESGILNIKGLLDVATLNGIFLESSENKVNTANLYNKKSGSIYFENSVDLTLKDIVNDSVDGSILIFNDGSITSEGKTSSGKDVIVWGRDDIGFKNKVEAKDAIVLYSAKGNINTDGLYANSIDVFTENGNITAQALKASENVNVDTENGDISVKEIKVQNGKAHIIADNGNIAVDNAYAKDELLIKAVGVTGNISASSVESNKNSVEISAAGGVDVSLVKAGKLADISAEGNININKLIVTGENAENQTSKILAMGGLTFDTVESNGSLDAFSANDLVVNNIKTEGFAEFSSYENVSIDSINSNGWAFVGSYGKGNIDVNSIKSSEEAFVFNSEGDISVKSIESSDNIYISNIGAGNIEVSEKLETTIEGSLYVSGHDGDILLNDVKIDGSANLHNSDGKIIANDVIVGNDIAVGSEFGDIRLNNLKAKKGSAIVSAHDGDINIYLADINNDFNVNAKNNAYVTDANVKGSMLLSGLEGNCESNTLNVGGDLKINTDSGRIVVQNATVGNDTYISVNNEDGGDILIKGIETGKDLNGSLYIDSYSNKEDSKIDIYYAKAAYKLIINSMGKVFLNAAYTLNGLLEVKANRDVVAEYIYAAKQALILITKGKVTVNSIVAENEITINNGLGEIYLNNAQTLNPDYGRIMLLNGSGNIYVNNATSSQDLSIISNNGDVVIANTDVALSANILGENQNIFVDNLNVGSYLDIETFDGNISISNTKSSNLDLRVFGGNSSFTNVKILHDFKIATYKNADVRIKNSSSEGKFLLSNEGNVSIDSFSAKLSDVSNVGDLNISNMSAEEFILLNEGFASIGNSTISSFVADNRNGAEFNNLKFKSFELNNSGIANINYNSDILNDSLEIVNSGMLNASGLHIENVDLNNKNELNIENSTVTNLIADNSGKLEMLDLIGTKMKLSNSGDAEINSLGVHSVAVDNTGTLLLDNSAINMAIPDFMLTNKGDANIRAIDISDLKFENIGNFELADSNVKNFESNNNGNMLILDSKFNKFATENAGKLDLDNVTVKNYSDFNQGEIFISDSSISNYVSDNSGKSLLENSVVNAMNLGNKGNVKVADSNISSFASKNTGKILLDNSYVKSMNLANNGEVNITSSVVSSLDADNSKSILISNSDISDFITSNNGNIAIDSTKFSNLSIDNNGEINLKNIETTDFEAINKGRVDVSVSKISNLSADSSGSLTIKNSNVVESIVNNKGSLNIDSVDSDIFVLNSSGNSNIKNSGINSAVIVDSGNSTIDNITINDFAVVDNSAGSMKIGTLNIDTDAWIENEADMDINNLSVNGDFNIGVSSGANTNYKYIEVADDLNIYASKGTFKGGMIDIGNDMNIHNYNDYLAPSFSRSARASFAIPSGSSRLSVIPDDGFVLRNDQLNIGGNLVIDNNYIDIDVDEGNIGKNLTLNGNHENIAFKKLNVNKGSVYIKGNTGKVGLGEAYVAGNINVELNNGDFSGKSLNVVGDTDLKIGGNITVDNNIESEVGYIRINSTQSTKVGGNIIANNGDVKVLSGSNISIDGTTESNIGNVNMIAGGNIDAYKILAKQQGNIEAYRGDIVIGQINGKTLVIKEGANDRSLSIGEANVDSEMRISADYIDITKINHNGNDKPLDISFDLIRGRAMDNVHIGDVQTSTGVNMNSLISTYADIHVSHEYFNLTKTYLLRQGDLSNSSVKFRLFGSSPYYSEDPDIIAYFSPGVRGKIFADINFINTGEEGIKDYIPLVSKEDFQRFFNEYTVIQRFETMIIASDKRTETMSDEFYKKYYIRSAMDKAAWYSHNIFGIAKSDNTMNLGEYDYKVELELDYDGYELNKASDDAKQYSQLH